ncbi:MAG: T9SS type A sorting domain-containing protein [Flavobacteriales bacterium]|nr:T9SS type A sorting domain-containing protein [Flavobacteriales bacterium]
MSRSSSALCALVLPLFSLAQGTFQQTYDWDYQGTLLGGTPKALLKVSDGYLVGGNAFGSLFGAGLMHTDEAGVPTWNRSYDITGDGFGEGSISTMLALPDGGFIVAGAAPALFYARVDAAGTMLWAKRIAGNFNIATDLLLLADGNILFTGKRQGNAYDAFVIKADLDSTVIWSQFYGTETENSEFFTSVVETPDNGFLCLGYRNHLTQYMDLLLTKLDANGAVEWSTRYGSSEIFTLLYSDDIRATADGNYVLTGTSYVALSALNPDNVVEPIVMKVDPMGVLLWSNKLSALPALGGQGITNDHVRNRIMPDGTMMLLLTSVDQPSTGLQLVHADASGIPLNAINLRNNTVPSYVTAMALLPDNSVALAGYNNPGTYVSSTFLTHTDETGHTACNDTASTSVAVAFEPPTNAGGVVASACTFTYTDITPATPAVVVVVHHACSGTGIHDLAAQQPTLTLYPNPASTNVQVRLEGLPTSGSTVVLFDATGAVVRTMAMGDSMAYLDVQDLSPGIHLVRWMGKDGRMAQAKLLVLGAR